jgi:zinc transport system ATP-binding protein
MQDRNGDPVVELMDVVVKYGPFVALDGATLSVWPGEFVGVIGPNGSGKTTLLKVILGLVQPASGTVRVFGRDRAELEGDVHRLGYVPQLTEMDRRFPVSALDVVLMGRYGKIGLGRRPSREDKEKARWALEQVGVAHLADRQIGQLSGGQLQRMLVARALVTEPELLLLDEPTTGMDPAIADSSYELLNDLNRSLGVTIIMTSHDVSVVSQYVSTVACINKRLVCHGLPQETLTPETLEGVYGKETMWLLHSDVPHLVLPDLSHELTDESEEE